MTPEDLKDIVEFQLRTQMRIGDHRFSATLFVENEGSIVTILDCLGCKTATSFRVDMDGDTLKIISMVSHEFGAVVDSVMNSCQETMDVRCVSSVMDV